MLLISRRLECILCFWFIHIFKAFFHNHKNLSAYQMQTLRSSISTPAFLIWTKGTSGGYSTEPGYFIISHQEKLGKKHISGKTEVVSTFFPIGDTSSKLLFFHCHVSFQGCRGLKSNNVYGAVGRVEWNLDFTQAVFSPIPWAVEKKCFFVLGNHRMFIRTGAAWMFVVKT